MKEPKNTKVENKEAFDVELEIEHTHQKEALSLLNKIIPTVEIRSDGKKYAHINIPFFYRRVLNGSGEFDECSAWLLMHILKHMPYEDALTPEVEDKIDALWYIRYLFLYNGVKSIPDVLLIPFPEECDSL